MGKLEYTGFHANPVTENSTAFLIFSASTIIGLIGSFQNVQDNFFRHLRIGAFVSFLIPMTLDSVTCLLIAFCGETFDLSKTLSVLVSISILLYFILEIASLAFGSLGKFLLEENSFMRCFDVELPEISKSRMLNFTQLAVGFFLAVLLGLGINSTFFSGFGICVLNGSLVAFIFSSMTKRLVRSKDKKVDPLGRILSLKVIDSSAKLLTSALHFFLALTVELRNLFFTQILSIVVVCLLLTSVASTIWIIIIRIFQLNAKENSTTNIDTEAGELKVEDEQVENQQTYSELNKPNSQEFNHDMQVIHEKSIDSHHTNPQPNRSEQDSKMLAEINIEIRQSFQQIAEQKFEENEFSCQENKKLPPVFSHGLMTTDRGDEEENKENIDLKTLVKPLPEPHIFLNNHSFEPMRNRSITNLNGSKF